MQTATELVDADLDSAEGDVQIMQTATELLDSDLGRAEEDVPICMLEIGGMKVAELGGGCHHARRVEWVLS